MLFVLLNADLNSYLGEGKQIDWEGNGGSKSQSSAATGLFGDSIFVFGGNSTRFGQQQKLSFPTEKATVLQPSPFPQTGISVFGQTQPSPGVLKPSKFTFSATPTPANSEPEELKSFTWVSENNLLRA